ncbi:MAG: peptidoglycan-binding protein [Kibdelosporangium sp.]
MTRKGIFWAVGALVVLVGGVLVVTFAGGPRRAATASGPEPARTVAVTRTDLSVSQDFAGTLGFGAETALKARMPGTVTWLPAAGTRIGQGGTLFKVDNRPTVLLLGDTPTYRKLDKPGIQGPDVKVVNSNLADLGYLGRSGGRSDTFTEASMAAVRKWQKVLRTDQTGIIDLPDVLVLPAAVRVGSVSAQLGTPADTALIGVAPDAKVVTLSLDPSDASGISGGTKVNIMLPNGTKTTGVVAATSRAKAPETTGPAPGGPKITVSITVGDAAAVADLEGPVSVKLSGAAKQGVLAVPVGALLALKEGGYALQVFADNATRLVPVRTGMFANGLVEVSGNGIADGTTVVTAS